MAPLNNTRLLWLCFWIAALSFLPALRLYFVGEEAIAPLSSLEMWQRGAWITHTIYGLNVQHNPLFNWIHIPLAAAAGWEHGLAIARAIMIASVVLTGLVLAGLARVLFRDAAFAAFAALVYITLGDLFFYRGWLAYADPLYGFFIFSAIAALWIGCERRAGGWLVLAVVAITCAFMSKAFTGYVFYGVAGLVLLVRRDYRRFLLGPASIASHLLAAAAPAVWLLGVLGGAGQGGRMFYEILLKLAPEGIGAYLFKLLSYPVEVLLRLLPASGLAAYFLWRGRITDPEREPEQVRIALAIAVLNFLPYWLSPQGGIRYLVPIFPLFALVLARMLWRAGQGAMRTTLAWLGAAIALKLAFLLVALPYYQASFRGANYLETARDVDARTRYFPLYAMDWTSAGLSVVTHIDVMRLPAPVITYAPQGWDNGFVLAGIADPNLGRVVKAYKLGGDDLYLICRGAACAGSSPAR
jgi:4-amino-4-deoxy-L-arabinose transferase-like glycosyltransferase